MKTGWGLPHARQSWIQQSCQEIQMRTSATIKCGKTYLRKVTKCHRVEDREETERMKNSRKKKAGTPRSGENKKEVVSRSVEQIFQ